MQRAVFFFTRFVPWPRVSSTCPPLSVVPARPCGTITLSLLLSYTLQVSHTVYTVHDPEPMSGRTRRSGGKERKHGRKMDSLRVFRVSQNHHPNSPRALEFIFCRVFAAFVFAISKRFKRQSYETKLWNDTLQGRDAFIIILNLFSLRLTISENPLYGALLKCK